MAKVDPRDFLLNTDYEMDKIIYFREGTLNAGQYDIDYPHNLPFTPLLFGVCAFNQDFSDSRSVPFQQLTHDNSIDFHAYANATNVRLSYINYAGTPSKIYYRLYGFEPSDSHAKVGGTSKYAKNFILNTDYNYCKLFKKGITTPTSTVAHNLGYLPQVLAWGESTAGWTAPIETSTTGGYIAVTNTTVAFQYPSGMNKMHYRIYYDEA